MEITGSLICRALLFTGVVFYFTFLLSTSNRYSCPSPDVVVNPAVRPVHTSPFASERENVDRQNAKVVEQSVVTERKSEGNVAAAGSNVERSGVGGLESGKNVSGHGDGHDAGGNSSSVRKFGSVGGLETNRNGPGGKVEAHGEKKGVVYPAVNKSSDSAAGVVTKEEESPTQLKHLLIGIVGSERAWHQRRKYIEAWWRPNVTRGYLFLDMHPTGELLPWSPKSPPYRISKDLTKFLNKPDVTPHRIAHGIKEILSLESEDLRWLVMGDDDSIFFLDNMVEVLAKYDHTKYYYIGARSEFVLSNFLFSFKQGFGGGGFALSFPLAKLLAKYLDHCLLKYHFLIAADQMAMSCLSDLGFSLTEHQGFHQIDLRGDLSGFLSSHPNVPLISLHHFDMMDPIFPAMDRYASTRHLMKAAEVDQQRMLQQTVCYYRKYNWTFSIAWGYSAHIYERLMPRSYLQYPIETFRQWLPGPGPPFYMFNTRLATPDPCEAPHIFFFQDIDKSSQSNLTNINYARSAFRGMPTCIAAGNYSAEVIMKIRVYSPTSRRKQAERSECCDVVGLSGSTAKIKYRECTNDEVLI